MKIAIYARVSTKDQHCENQLLDLRRYAEMKRWEVAHEYVEKVSGLKSKRPEFDKLMDDVHKHRVDGVLVWRFDRFSRSITQLVFALQTMRANNIEFISYQENIDTSTATGKFMFAVIAAMSEFELNLRRERVASALERLKLVGLKLGRPKEIGKDKIEAIIGYRSLGFTSRRISSIVGISKSQVQREIKCLTLNGEYAKMLKPMGDTK